MSTGDALLGLNIKSGIMKEWEDWLGRLCIREIFVWNGPKQKNSKGREPIQLTEWKYEMFMKIQEGTDHRAERRWQDYTKAKRWGISSEVRNVD